VKDLVIDACRWHVEYEALPFQQRAKEQFAARYNVLLNFLRTEGLLIDPSLGEAVPDWIAFEFRQSHLTPLGFALVKLCHGSWNPAFEQAHTQRHLTQWKRKLAVLRQEAK
jgi:hypothetical protein